MWNDLVVSKMSLSQAIRVVRGFYSSEFISVCEIQSELARKEWLAYEAKQAI